MSQATARNSWRSRPVSGGSRSWGLGVGCGSSERIPSGNVALIRACVTGPRSSESSWAACPAMNSAKVTLGPVKPRGARESTSSSTAQFRPSSASGTARIAASPRRRSVSASSRSRRLVLPRSAMTSLRPVRSTSRTVGRGSSGALSPSKGARPPVRLRAVRTVNASSASGKEILHSVTPAPSAATRARANSGARRSPPVCAAGAARVCAAVATPPDTSSARSSASTSARR